MGDMGASARPNFLKLIFCGKYDCQLVPRPSSSSSCRFSTLTHISRKRCSSNQTYFVAKSDVRLFCQDDSSSSLSSSLLSSSSSSPSSSPFFSVSRAIPSNTWTFSRQSSFSFASVMFGSFNTAAPLRGREKNFLLSSSFCTPSCFFSHSSSSSSSCDDDVRLTSSRPLVPAALPSSSSSMSLEKSGGFSFPSNFCLFDHLYEAQSEEEARTTGSILLNIFARSPQLFTFEDRLVLLKYLVECRTNFREDERIQLLVAEVRREKGMLELTDEALLKSIESEMYHENDGGSNDSSTSAYSGNVKDWKRIRYFQDLTVALREIDQTLKPLRAQHRKKKDLVETIAPLLQKRTGGHLQTFGSCENGFWTEGSDVDSCLVLKNCCNRAACLSKLKLIRQLLERENVGKVQVISAQVPIAKVYDSNGVNICDVSINNTAALENSQLAGTLSRIDTRIRPLGRFIKHWATRRQINNRSQGTLSTYTLLLQLFYFLQRTDPSILPLHKYIQQTLFKGYNLNKQSLGELIFDFFMLFGGEEFAGGETGRTVDIYDCRIETNDQGVLVMKCPLTKKNVNPFTIPVWKTIHREFKRAKQLLEDGASLEKLCEPSSEPPLRREARTRRNQARKARLLAKQLGYIDTFPPPSSPPLPSSVTSVISNRLNGPSPVSSSLPSMSANSNSRQFSRLHKPHTPQPKQHPLKVEGNLRKFYTPPLPVVPPKNRLHLRASLSQVSPVVSSSKRTFVPSP